ncbi:protein kinase [Acidobacteriota bacterium]
MKCPKCQSDNPETVKFCGECGTNITHPEKAQPSITKTIETPKEELTRGTLFANRYEIIEELGKGGMGKVYRVFDKKIESEVALKLVRSDIAADKNTVERFRNELKLARDITHKSVCRMYDLNEEQGTHYITMEYVSGGDLKRFIRRSGQLSIGTALKIAIQLCEGLSEAHKLGVIHRDLKPNNIMIDAQGNARIMDFGIARSLSTKGITARGVMIGTPEYMSPEQVEGKDVDQRSDIYSLGIILYEMVTGRVPFEGDTPFTVGVKQKSETPKDPREFNTQISDELNDVILKCLEKEKGNRYQNTGEVLSVLTQIEKGIPTTERPALKSKSMTSREITVRFTPKRLFVPAVLILILAVAAILLFRKPGTELNPNRILVVPFVNQTGDESLDKIGEIAAHSIIQYLSQVEEVEVVPSTTVTQISNAFGTTVDETLGSLNIQSLTRETGAGTVVSGVCHIVDDTLHFQTEIADAKHGRLLITIPDVSRTSENRMEAVQELSERITGALASHFNVRYGAHAIPHLTIYEAYREYMLGNDLFDVNFAQAIIHYERATKLDPDFLFPYIHLAMGAGTGGNWAKADSIHQFLNNRREQLTPYERHWVDAGVARVQGRYDKVLESYQQARILDPQGLALTYLVGWSANLTNRRQIAVEALSHVDVESYRDYFLSGWAGPAWFRHLTDAHHMLENYKQELKEVRRARKYYPDRFYEQEARALIALGRIREVKSVMEKMLAVTSLSNQGRILSEIALVLRRHGHFDEYREMADRAVDWFNINPPDEGSSRSTRDDPAEARYVAERWEDAQSLFEELAIEFPDIISYKGRLGTIAARRGDKEKALQVYEELNNLNLPYLRGEHTFWCASILSLLGEREQATSLLREALAKGRGYGPQLLYNIDFESLRDYQPFQDLLKPKE